MNIKKYTEKTKLQYVKELETLFKKSKLSQTLYNEYANKGHAYRAILNVILKTCWYYNIPLYNYKEVRGTRSSRQINNKSIESEKIWNEEEVRSLACKLGNDGLKALCSYYIGAGIRFSSLVRLRWTDFYWESWLTNRTLPGKVVVHAKGNKTAVLVVHPYLMDVLFKIAEQDKKLFQGVPYKNFRGENYIFITDKELEIEKERLKKEELNNVINDSVLSELKIDIEKRAMLNLSDKLYESFKYSLNKYASDFKVGRIKTHSFRKSAATNLLRKGWPLIKIKVMLMHNSISTTEIYTKVTEEEVFSDYEEMIKKERV